MTRHLQRLATLLLSVTIVAAAPDGSASATDGSGSPPQPPGLIDSGHARQDKILGRPCHNGRALCGQVMRRLDPAVKSSKRIGIAYELYPRRDRSKPSLGTIVAVEGGPGYATTGSRSYYLDLFRPLLDRRQLLLVDNRGTGKSDPISCPWLQSYQGNRNQAIGACGRHLGRRSDLYGSAFAADDLAAVLDHLGIAKIDLYGDSYGTFFAQTFALRHRDRLRTLILDAAYFVGGKDPWYSDTNRALRHAFTVACRRSPPCRHRPGRPMHRIARLAARLRQHPIRGRAPNADGRIGPARADINSLINIVTAAATTPAVYRELDAAARAVLRPRPYAEPLLRLVRETTYAGGAGRPAAFSEGLYVAVSCNDYPQPYDVTAPVRIRYRQFHAAIRRLQRNRPRIFAPFTVREWVRSDYGYYDDCLRWPAPSRWVHPVPRRATYPHVPTLVLVGDLDSLTSPEGARTTAQAFPNATFVQTANLTHVSALVDFDQCASLLVRRFVRKRTAGNTSCARRYHENRLVGRFSRSAAGTGWHGRRYRTVRIAAATAADVLARWLSMYGPSGVGLQGGRFSTAGGGFAAPHPVATWHLNQVRWVNDVAVSGTMRWHRRSGRVGARLRVTGNGAASARLLVRWNDSQPHARATARGVVGGRHVRITFRAP